MIHKKIFISCLCSILIFSTSPVFASNVSSQVTSHIVQKSDSYWKLSKLYNINFFDLLKLNNATVNSQLDIGDIVMIPLLEPVNSKIHTVSTGESYYSISKLYNINFFKLLEFNNASTSTLLNIGDTVLIPSTAQPVSSIQTPTSNTVTVSSPSITSTTHKVVSGDTLWNISIKYGIPLNELLSANNMTENSLLTIGMTLSIPVHNIPVKSTQGDSYGELLDWWTEAQYVLPVNSVFEVVDFYTNKSFSMKRTTGASHADCEPLTSTDAQIIKEIWGGTYSWDTRPIIIKYNNRKLAASMSSFPHAGNDAAPGGEYTSTRSGNYGYGYNYDWVKNNSVDGVMDIHFLNSTRHSDNAIDSDHQKCINISAGTSK